MMRGKKSIYIFPSIILQLLQQHFSLLIWNISKLIFKIRKMLLPRLFLYLAHYILGNTPVAAAVNTSHLHIWWKILQYVHRGIKTTLELTWSLSFKQCYLCIQAPFKFMHNPTARQYITGRQERKEHTTPETKSNIPLF